MNDQIGYSIHDASIPVAGPSTDKPKQLKPRPWWTASTKLTKIKKSLWYSIWKSCDKSRAGYVYITEKYRPEPGLEPRVSRLVHEYATTELSKPTQFCYLIFGCFLTTLDDSLIALYRMVYHPKPYCVCESAGVVQGVRAGTRGAAGTRSAAGKCM